MSLTPSGGMTITTPGTVVSGLHITGAVSINANNVTLTDDLIENSATNSYAVYVKPGVSGALIEHSTIRGENSGSNAIEYGILNGGSGTVGNDLSLTNCTECYAGPGTIENSFLNVSATIPGSHYEDTYYGGGNGPLTIQHDTMLNPQPQTACVYTYSDFGQVRGLTLSDNLMAGGGYTIYGGGSTASTVSITGNRFSNLYYPNSGNFGLDAYMNWNSTTWSGNMWDQSGKPSNG